LAQTAKFQEIAADFQISARESGVIKLDSNKQRKLYDEWDMTGFALIFLSFYGSESRVHGSWQRGEDKQKGSARAYELAHYEPRQRPPSRADSPASAITIH
jgi:hypothetical protein